jgi:hypothetical protein
MADVKQKMVFNSQLFYFKIEGVGKDVTAVILFQSRRSLEIPFFKIKAIIIRCAKKTYTHILKKFDKIVIIKIAQ